MPDSVVFSLEGEVAYTDNSHASFGASIDQDGHIKSEGLATAFGDILTTIKALFTAIGGTLTMTRAGTAKVVRSKNVRIDALATVSGVKYHFFSENTETTGTLTGGGGSAAYDVIVANFAAQIRNTINDLTGSVVVVA